MKKSRIEQDPTRKSEPKLKRSDIIINPEPYPIVDKTKRKNPVYINLVENN